MSKHCSDDTQNIRENPILTHQWSTAKFLIASFLLKAYTMLKTAIGLPSNLRIYQLLISHQKMFKDFPEDLNLRFG